MNMVSAYQLLRSSLRCNINCQVLSNTLEALCLLSWKVRQDLHRMPPQRPMTDASLSQSVHFSESSDSIILKGIKYWHIPDPNHSFNCYLYKRQFKIIKKEFTKASNIISILISPLISQEKQ